MRIGFFYEGLVLLSLVCIFSFLIFDEEPILDFSDWNSIHIWLFLISLFVVFFELTLRSRYGQYVFKDNVSLFALFSFWFGLENYIRLLLLVFSSHALTPLEIELMELIEVYQYMSGWLVTQVLAPTLCFGLMYFILFIQNKGLTNYQSRSLAYSTYVITLGLLFIFILTGWDFLVSSMSSMSSWYQNDVFYLQPKTALTYDRGLLINDQFEWHRERTWPYAMHFEDLYFFFFSAYVGMELGVLFNFFFLR